MSNRLSSFIPLAPQITQANIASQFPKDTIKVPLPEITHSEKLEKAEFDTKERKKLAKEKEAMPGGQFPIRNKTDLSHAIKDVPRSNNPAAAKAWIKKRAKELDCEDCLPGSWEKATEDELNMFNDKLEKGGKGSGPHKKGDMVTFQGDESRNHKKIKGKIHGIDPNDKDVYIVHHEGHDGKSHVHKDEILQNHDSSKEEKTEKSIKLKIKKDMDGDGGGDEMEESVNKAFDNIFSEDIDPIEKAFENLIGVETDPIEKAFNNLFEKAEGSRGGKVIGHTTSGKPIYSHFGHEGHKAFTRKDHHEAAEHHDSLAEAAHGMKNEKKARFHEKESINHFRQVTQHNKKSLKDQDSYLNARYSNHHTD